MAEEREYRRKRGQEITKASIAFILFLRTFLSPHPLLRLFLLLNLSAFFHIFYNLLI